MSPLDLFPQAKLALYGGITLVVVIAILGAYGYWKYSQHALGQLHEQLALQNIQILAQNLEIEQQKADIEQIQKANKRLSILKVANQKALDDMEQKLTNAHLGQLGILEPEKVKIKINRGAAQRKRCLEIASGSPVTISELQLPEPARNHVCPQLFNYPN